MHSVAVDCPVKQLPYLTAELAGTGGTIKQCAEDFEVQEVPLYEPSGTGTHTYFCIEKRQLSTLAAVSRIARALGRKPHDIGFAGLKDARAVTRQVLSIEHVDPGDIEGLAVKDVHVLWVRHHTNKLKLGHLRGNRFCIRVRGAHPQCLDRARRIVDLLQRRGVPNYFGEQRFGSGGDNARVGRAVLQHDYEEAIRLFLGAPGPADGNDVRRARTLCTESRFAEAAQAWPGAFRDQIRVCRALTKYPGAYSRAWMCIEHSLRRLLISAVQSQLFNVILARRLDGIDCLLPGDLAWKHANGACFFVEDADAEQPRCDRLEISPTGPVYGRKMTQARFEPGELEQALMIEAGLTLKHFETKLKMKLHGARRPLRVPMSEFNLEMGEDRAGPFLQLKFFLPPGSYATSLLREICKNEGEAG